MEKGLTRMKCSHVISLLHKFAAVTNKVGGVITQNVSALR